MGLGNSGIGFISTGGGGGSGSGTTVVIKQYKVGDAGAPVDGTNTFDPSPSILGTTMYMSISGFGDLYSGVDFTYTVSGGHITEIVLTGGQLFNTSQLLTIIALS